MKSYGSYEDHIRIGNPSDALQVIEQVLEETEFDPESVRAVLETIKDALERGII